MNKYLYFLILTAAVLLVFLFSTHSNAQQSPAAGSASVGSPLGGWHVQGPVDWHVEQGEIVGRISKSGNTGAGLVLDRPFQDVGVQFSFRCGNCDIGVLFMEKAGDPASGTYVSLARADAGSVFRIRLDANGQEVDRKSSTSQVPQRPQQVQQTRIQPRPRVRSDDWNQVEVFMRGESVTGSINGASFRGVAAGIDAGERYGPVALRVSGGAGTELRFKEVSIEDLTQRAALPAEFKSDRFRRQQLTDLFYSEGVAVADLNRDGFPDIVAGAFYYLGPDYKVARELYSSEPYNPSTNSDTFISFSYDFDGDEWPDVLTIKTVRPWPAVLYMNPHGENRHWDKFTVIPENTAEAMALIDIDRDGRPELITSMQGQVGYAKPERSDPTKPWTFHGVSEKGPWGGHGIGGGDINRDGRIDIVNGAGWWEQPAEIGGLWPFHPAPFGAGTDILAYDLSSDAGSAQQMVTKTGGADILVYDVNGDGLSDVITSLDAHRWGLAWFEQKRDGVGAIEWVRHMIIGGPSEISKYGLAFSQMHGLVLADIDGDGLKDFVTGKRWWAHGDHYGGDADPQSPAVLYWFKLVRKPGGQVEFIPNQIDNNSGVGTQFTAADLNGDGAIDIVTSARKGVFAFFNKH